MKCEKILHIASSNDGETTKKMFRMEYYRIRWNGDNIWTYVDNGKLPTILVSANAILSVDDTPLSYTVYENSAALNEIGTRKMYCVKTCIPCPIDENITGYKSFLVSEDTYKKISEYVDVV